MELRLIAVILMGLTLMTVQARNGGFGGGGDMSSAFRKNAWVVASGHETTRSSFNPLDLAAPLGSGGSRFIRVD